MFFRKCLLPEILGNRFTRDNISTSGSIDGELPSSGEPSNNNYTSIEEETFCYCRGPEELMIACDNPDCPIEWFHLICLVFLKESCTILTATTIGNATRLWYEMLSYTHDLHTHMICIHNIIQ